MASQLSKAVAGRVLAVTLSLSAAGFAGWQASEGFTDHAVIPTEGDVPTIGYGSTRYEDGSRVKMGDRITRERAAELAMNLAQKDCALMAKSLPGVKLYQVEYDVYCDFVGQYGIGTFRKSSIRKYLLEGNYAAACQALLLYKYAAGYDCSTPGNKRCYGVWERQLKRHSTCMGVQ